MRATYTAIAFWVTLLGATDGMAQHQSVRLLRAEQRIENRRVALERVRARPYSLLEPGYTMHVMRVHHAENRLRRAEHRRDRIAIREAGSN
jgi:hypothetical protein